MSSFLSDIKPLSYSKEQVVVLLVAACLFMPFLISFAVILFAVVYAFFYKPFLCSFKLKKENILLYILGLLVLVVPLVYGRYISFLIGIAAIAMVMLFIFIKIVMTQKLFEISLDVACASSVICFVYAIFEKILLGFNVRSTGGMFNANYYGAMCEFLILISIYKIFKDKKRWLCYAPITLISFLGIILSDCQSAWFATAAALAVFMFISQNKKKGIITLLICLGVIVLGILTPGILPRLGQTPTSMQIRINIWLTSIKGIKAHFFFGQGLMTYWFTYMLYDGFATYHAHNIFLDSLLNLGAVGSFIVSYYCYKISKKIRLTFKCEGNKLRTSLIVGIIMCVLVHGITDATILWVQTSGAFLLVLSGLYIKNKKSVDKV